MCLDPLSVIASGNSAIRNFRERVTFLTSTKILFFLFFIKKSNLVFLLNFVSGLISTISPNSLNVLSFMARKTILLVE